MSKNGETMNITKQKLHEFASKHELVFVEQGQVGFGRDCTGFTHDDTFVAHNPISAADHELIRGFADYRLYSPSGVPDAYHKHACLCVLAEDGDYDSAQAQLLLWVEHLESLGELEVAEYQTGATGIQAIISGVFARAIRVKVVNNE